MKSQEELFNMTVMAKLQREKLSEGLLKLPESAAFSGF